MRPSLTITSQVLVAAVFGLSALSVQAVVLNPGDTGVALPGTTVAANPQLAGTIIIDEAIPFSFSAGSGLGNITGQVQQRIVRSSVDNTLDFYWRVQNHPTSAGAIGSFRIGDFVSPEYNANWRIDGLGDTAPSDATRFSGILESFVNFDFDVFSTDPADGLLPGQSSYFMFLDTTATNYAKTAKFDVTNMVQNPISGAFAAYSPTVVPVPAAVWLFGSGLLSLVGIARRTNVG
ncbi:MAG: VPLPA-CTERM sorting domain-containing protein [Gammaproteobacteria bacterium]|jgi:hypothetical protein